MTHRKLARGLLVALAAFVVSAAAQAQLFRAYLAPSGSDTNPCTLSQPCRLLPAALGAVANGGEIWMLDSANYNTATVFIGKSVSILAVPGAVGSILAISGPAIAIGASGLTVGLRNVVIAPLSGGGGTVGLYMTGASSLFVENSLIVNLAGSAVVVNGLGKLKIANSIIRNNSGWAVQLDEGAFGAISGTHMVANGGGVRAQSLTATSSRASIYDSVIFGGSYGAGAFSNIAGGEGRVSLTRCTIDSASSDALRSETTSAGSAAVTVSRSMLTNNNRAWYQMGAGAILQSLGNNHITDNAGSFGSLTTTALQ